ncbi:MAG: sugar phosphate isomerase/epimerase [Candidatus Aquicultor sp.]|nr:sugar phosphate isomerase/epimerase [Candidatus Aquicultor sp.]
MLTVKGFGINADAGRLDGSLDLLARDLRYFQDIGFDYVEIPVHGVEVVRNGELIPERVREVSKLLKEFSLRYTVHAPNPLNLMDMRELHMHVNLFRSSIKFTHEIGAEVLVYHCGRFMSEEAFLLPEENRSLSPGTMEEMKQAEVGALRDMADYALGFGVEICLENARPYLDGSPYCYGERLDQLVSQVRAVNKGNVGINLDLGHAYLAANYYGFDFIEALELVKPLVRHMHIHDNFGKPSASYERKQPELVAAGRGDCHMPIGWGGIPAAEVFNTLKDYKGVFMQELRPRYMKYCAEILAQAKDMFAQIVRV